MSAAPTRRSLAGLALLVLAVWLASQWWVARHRDDWGAQLRERAAPGDIELFSAATCPHCTVARQWLQGQRVPFSECRIDHDATCRERFQALGGAGTPLLLVRGRAQLGFSAPRVLQALQAPRLP